MNIPAKILRKVNDAISAICRGYRQQIPLGDIFAALRKEGLVPVQEDGREWAGLLCGKTGQARIDVAPVLTAKKEQDGLVFDPADNTLLCLSWYKMDETGRYETVAYLS
jgi:hypothetical protein